MKLQTAELITHGEQMDGINCAVRAVVRLDGKDVAAIVKKIEQPLIAAECFAALLLKGWGLSVPEPILVKLHDDTYAFGSLEVKYPSLKQSLSLDKLPDTAKEAAYKKLAAIIGKWKQTPLAIASDEAIGNKDRNTGNILWDGGKPWFVDHERSFGLIAQEDLNKLAMMVRMGDDRDNISRLSTAYHDVTRCARCAATRTHQTKRNRFTTHRNRDKIQQTTPTVAKVYKKRTTIKASSRKK